MFPKALRIVEEEIEYWQSISCIRSEVLYDDNDEDDNIRGYQRRLIASVKPTSDVKVNISAIELDNIPTPCTLVSKEQHSSVTATELSKRWLVGFVQGTATLKSTTQEIVR